MSYEITLSTKRAWVTDPTDPYGAAVVCGTRDSGGTTTALDGELVHYADDWIGAASYGQDDTGRTITLAHVTADDVEQLRKWRGQVLLFRFTEGERIFAVYFGFTYTRVLRASDQVRFDVSVTYNRVSFTEAV